MIYALNMASVLAYAAILKPDRGRYKKLFASLVVIQFTLLAGLQYGVGADYISYLKIYNAVRALSWKELLSFSYAKEPVYLLYTKIMGILFQDNFVPYFLGMAFIVAFFLVKAIFIRHEKYVWSVYIYLCMGLLYISMNQVRQLMAISIVLYAVSFLEQGNVKKYIFWIIIAAGIHNSALVMLPCFLLRDLKLRSKKKSFFVFAAACILFYFAAPVVLNNVLSKTSYGWMLEYQAGETGNMVINLVYRSVLMIGCICYIRPVLKKNKNHEILYWLCMVGIVFQVMAVYATSVARITTYFYAVFLFLIPTVLSSIPSPKVKLIAKMVVAIGMFCYHYYYLVYNLGGMPYQSVFSAGI